MNSNLNIAVLLAAMLCGAAARELNFVAGGSKVGGIGGTPAGASGASAVTPVLSLSRGEECAKKAEDMGIPAFVRALFPCLMNQGSPECCAALSDLFGPDEDEETDLEYCLCSKDYLAGLKEGLSSMPFVSVDMVLGAFDTCNIPHAVNETHFKNCEAMP